MSEKLFLNGFDSLTISEKRSYNSLVKSAKIDLKSEFTSLSFWCSLIAKHAKGEVLTLLKCRFNFELPKKQEDIVKELITMARKGYKFINEKGQICVIREVVEGNMSLKYFVVKERFTFDSVFTAILKPAKVQEVVQVSDKESALSELRLIIDNSNKEE